MDLDSPAVETGAQAQDQKEASDRWGQCLMASGTTLLQAKPIREQRQTRIAQMAGYASI